MGVLVTFAVGMVWWITAWGLGIKAFDAFLLTVFMVVVAATIRIYGPFVRQLMGKEDPDAAQLGPAERV
jgi:hypothetical protein